LGRIQEIKTLEEKVKNGTWRANITPGTKAQTWQLARLLGDNLWSLETREGVARSLSVKEGQTENIYSSPFHRSYFRPPVPGGISEINIWTDKT